MTGQPPTFSFFFFNDTATTEIYTLSLHDALPICSGGARGSSTPVQTSTLAFTSPGCAGILVASTPWKLTTKIDRKSTRLNSSHDQISYAVFCLKKKKNTQLESDLRVIMAFYAMPV